MKEKLFETVVRMDATYQELLHEYQNAEVEFCKVRERLSDEEREAVDRYLVLGEEMDHRRAQLALQI